MWVGVGSGVIEGDESYWEDGGVCRVDRLRFEMQFRCWQGGAPGR